MTRRRTSIRSPMWRAVRAAYRRPHDEQRRWCGFAAVHKQYGETVALDGVDLEIGRARRWR